MRRNVVLLHAGSNDLNRVALLASESYAGASRKLGGLVDEVLAACPDAVVLVARIVSAGDESVDGRLMRRCRGSWRSGRGRGGRLGWESGSWWMGCIRECFFFAAAVLAGGTGANLWHRTTEGYVHKGDMWFAGLQDVARKGWITPPVGPDTTTR